MSERATSVGDGERELPPEVTVAELEKKLQGYFIDRLERGWGAGADIDDLLLILYRDDGTYCDLEDALGGVWGWLDDLYIDHEIDEDGHQILLGLGIIEE